MPNFIDQFRSSISGVLSGFDRLVFHGHLQGLTYTNGVMRFLSQKSVLLKEFLPWAKCHTERIKEDFGKQAKRIHIPVEHLRSSKTEKEPLARLRQRQRRIPVGSVAALSCVEPCRIWDVNRNRATHRLELSYRNGQCLHLYHYLDHARYGFMHIRLQTWFPFAIQVCMNGREYLRRAMEKAEVGFAMRDNCFTAIRDWPRAQKLSDGMLDLDWIKVLNGCAQEIFPSRRQLIGDVDYQWSVYQSEWATDCAFISPAALDAIYPGLVRHALTTSDTATVLRFLGRPLTKNGVVYGRFQQEVTTRLARREEGVCVKHHVGRNSAKFYNKQGNVYRTETTINDPAAFKVYRRTQGGDEKKDWKQLRRSVVDLKRRAEVSQAVNGRVLDHMAAASRDTPLAQQISGLSSPTTWHGERVRGLDLLGKDRPLVELLADPTGAINGIRNRDISARLATDQRGQGKTERQLGAMATRSLRILRAHGLIRKVPRSHRYQLTSKGMLVVTSIKSALSASTEKLVKLVA